MTLPISYEEVYQRSIDDPESFWGSAADSVNWYNTWERVLDDTAAPMYHWFKGATVNTCYNALDIHVESGNGSRIALIYDSPVTNTVRHYSYRELRDLVARCAGGLISLGVMRGDRVLIYMPMVPEAVIAMLACARIGAVHSVVFGGFSAHELTKRISDASPKIVISASCGIEVTRVIPYKPLLDSAIEMASSQPSRCVILQRPQLKAELQEGRDLGWESLLNADPVPCTPLAATDPLYILYTSGTTGVPKGVVRDNGGHLVALKWSMKHFYGMKGGDVFWAASDIGWVVGHSYIVYGPLFEGCTTILYEGKSVGTPDAGAFWRVISQHGVHALFTAPTAFRAIRREDPGGLYIRKYNLGSLRTLFLAGERCDPPTLLWAEQMLNVPVIDHWWQTETGWPIGGNAVGLGMLPVKPGSCTKPVPGYDIQVMDESGVPLPAGKIGNIVIKLPMPPGCLTTLWQKDREYVDTYLSAYPGYHLTADAGFIDDDGYLWIMGRIDDIINVSGHRLSTGAIEEVLASHQDVAECAVTGVFDPIKGEIPLGFVTLKAGVTKDHATIVKELISMVREDIGAIAVFKKAVVVTRLPKTRSGKILRGTMKKIATGVPFTIPPTIDDPLILDEIARALMEIGYPDDNPASLQSCN